MATDHFIEEVEEELRRERHMALWRKYGRLAMSAVFVVIIAVAATVGWRQYQQNRRGEAGLAFAEALDLAAANKTEEALKAVRALAADAPSGYAQLAKFQEASLLAGQGNEAAASQIYDSIAKDNSVDVAFRDLALILYGYAVVDRADPDALAARLKPLAAPTSPWRYSALELTALLAKRRGDEATVRATFQRLADDPGAPPGIRARAAEFLAVLGK